MNYLPPITAHGSAPRHSHTTPAAAAANRRVSFNVPQLPTRRAARDSDSVEDSVTFAHASQSDLLADSASPLSGAVEGRDCAPSGLHNGRFSLTSRPRLSSVGSTFHLADEHPQAHIARRIWGGQIDKATHSEMLQRVRAQFRKQNTSEHLPLVLPAQIPSSERAASPQLPKFSRGIRQYKRVHGTLGFDGSDTVHSADDDAGTAAQWGGGEMDEAEHAASAPPTLRGRRSASTSGRDTDELLEDALRGESTPPLTARRLESLAAAAALGAVTPGGDPAHNVLPLSSPAQVASTRSMATDGLSAPLGWASSDACRRASSARRASLVQSDAPLGALPTFEERWQRLRELEQLERLHIMSTEKWDRQVVVEMMVAHYVSFVLKPEMEELQARERVIRGFISYEEEHDRYELFNTHPLAKTLQTEVRALEAKKLKLARIAQLERGAARSAETAEDCGSELGRRRLSKDDGSPTRAPAVDGEQAGSSTTPITVPPAATAPLPDRASTATSRTSLATTRSTSATTPTSTTSAAAGVPARAAASGSQAAESAGEAAVAADPSDGIPSAEDARLILQRYARRKHARELKEAEKNLSRACNSCEPGSADEAETVAAEGGRRRMSELVVPVESVAARAPRRNTVGIADYIALLDEDGTQRTLIVQSERAERSQIYALLQDELRMVMDWQRKRMHLERLLYWRQLREEQLRKEVEALTDLSDPRELDPKTALLLSTLEEGEEEERAQLHYCEADERDDLLYWSGVLHVSVVGDDLVRQYREAQVAAWRLASDGFQQALETWEASTRASLVREEDDAWSTTVLRHGEAVHALYEVNVDPIQYAAVCTLQRYFKASLNGRLGRHYTNVQVGREVQATRNARKIERGLDELRTFQKQLQEEETAIILEIEAEHAAQRNTLLAAEKRNRVALCTEEEWSVAVVRQTAARSVAAALVAWRDRLVKEEHLQRLEVDVMEEMSRESVYRIFDNVRATVESIDLLMQEEAVKYASLCDEYNQAWSALLSSEYDARELIRIDAET